MAKAFLNSFFIGKLILPFISAFATAYSTSVLKRMVDRIVKVWCNSRLYRSSHNYIVREPYFKYSFSYFLLLTLVKAVSRPVRFMGRYLIWLSYYSKSLRAVKAFIRSGSKGRLALVSVSLVGLSLGYGLGVAVKGDMVGLITALGIFLFGLFTAYIANNYRFLRRSLVYRLYKMMIRVK